MSMVIRKYKNSQQNLHILDVPADECNECRFSENDDENELLLCQKSYVTKMTP